MKKALRMMQEMQAFLAERGIDAHVNTTSFTSTWSGKTEHACEITVFGDDEIVAKGNWASYDAERFEVEWAEFEAKVRERFFGWWE